ncbi:hypothetical protein J6590_066260 [Homalodisca vitripennis]|nr:hypothetical protein J6590_066260 [Homalodisca vitripennis]
MKYISYERKVVTLPETSKVWVTFRASCHARAQGLARLTPEAGPSAQQRELATDQKKAVNTRTDVGYVSAFPLSLMSGASAKPSYNHARLVNVMSRPQPQSQPMCTPEPRAKISASRAGT